MNKKLTFILFYFFGTYVFGQVTDTLRFVNSPDKDTIDFKYVKGTDYLSTTIFRIENDRQPKKRESYKTTSDRVFFNRANQRVDDLNFYKYEVDVSLSLKPESNLQSFNISDSEGNVCYKVTPRYPWLELPKQSFDTLFVQTDSLFQASLSIQNTGLSPLRVGIKFESENPLFGSLAIDSKREIEVSPGSKKSIKFKISVPNSLLKDMKVVDVPLKILLNNKEIPSNNRTLLVPLRISKHESNSFVFWIIIPILMVLLGWVAYKVLDTMKKRKRSKRDYFKELAIADLNNVDESILDGLIEKYSDAQYFNLLCERILCNIPKLSPDQFKTKVDNSHLRVEQKQSLISFYGQKFKKVYNKLSSEQNPLTDWDSENEKRGILLSFLTDYLKQLSENIESNNNNWKDKVLKKYATKISTIMLEGIRDKKSYNDIREYFNSLGIEEHRIFDKIKSMQRNIDNLIKYDEKSFGKSISRFFSNDQDPLRLYIANVKENAKLISKTVKTLGVDNEFDIPTKIESLQRENSDLQERLSRFNPLSVFIRTSTELNEIICTILKLNWKGLDEYYKGLIGELDDQSSFKNKVFPKLNHDPIQYKNEFSTKRTLRDMQYALTGIYRLNEFTKHSYFKSKLSELDFPFNRFSKAVEGFMFASSEFLNVRIDRPILFNPFNETYYERNRSDSPPIYRNIDDPDLRAFKNGIAKNSVTYLVKLGFEGEKSVVVVQ